MSVSLGVDVAPEKKIGRDAGWILAFHQYDRVGMMTTPVAEFSRDDYFAEIHASLPAGLEGGTYRFVIEGLTDDDYRKISLTHRNAPRIVELYLYYRDLELPDLGILSNVLGSDFINAATAGNSKIEKHAADRVATLWVQSVTRRAGSRKYQTTIVARELVFHLAQSRRPCGDPIDIRDERAALSELMRRAWFFPEGTVPSEFHAPVPRTTPPPEPPVPEEEPLYVDARQPISAALQQIAVRLEGESNQHGRGMLLIRDGKLHVGQRPIPLDREHPQPKPLTTSDGLLEVEALGPFGTDLNWDACDHPGEEPPNKAQFKLTLRGRPDVKPGDIVIFDAPPVDAEDTKGPLGGALGALGDLGAAVVEGISSLIGGGMTNPVQLYVQSVEHRLGRAAGFTTVVTGLKIGAGDPVLADDIWDGHTPAPDGSRASAEAAPSRGTVAEEAADAIVRLFRREIGRLSTTDVAEVRAFRHASSGAQPGQTMEIFRGMTPLSGSNVSRRADIKRPSGAPIGGVPYLTPFAWGRCGLVLPRYPGMRVTVTHRGLDATDPIDIGALWQTGHLPDSAQAGDWWLSLPAQAPAGNAPGESQVGAPQDYQQKVSQDLIDSSGNRVIEVGALVVRIGSSTLKDAGQRPAAPPASNAVTIEHPGQNARLQIKDDGSILIEGATIEIRSRGELKLKGTAVNVE